MNRNTFLAIATGLCVAGSSAWAHGPSTALHGGIVQTASDLSFELVPGSSTTALYIVDHGKPADVSKYTGKLTVLSGTNKKDVALEPSGDNKLVASTPVGSGARVVATVNTPAGKAVTVRFAVK